MDKDKDTMYFWPLLLYDDMIISKIIMNKGKLPFLKTVGRLSFTLQTLFKKFYVKVLIIENK